MSGEDQPGIRYTLMIFHFTLFRLSRPLAFFIVIRVLGGCSFYAKIVNCVLSIESCMPQWGLTIVEVKFDLISGFEFTS